MKTNKTKGRPIGTISPTLKLDGHEDEIISLFGKGLNFTNVARYFCVTRATLLKFIKRKEPLALVIEFINAVLKGKKLSWGLLVHGETDLYKILPSGTVLDYLPKFNGKYVLNKKWVCFINSDDKVIEYAKSLVKDKKILITMLGLEEFEIDNTLNVMVVSDAIGTTYSRL